MFRKTLYIRFITKIHSIVVIMKITRQTLFDRLKIFILLTEETRLLKNRQNYNSFRTPIGVDLVDAVKQTHFYPCCFMKMGYDFKMFSKKSFRIYPISRSWWKFSEKLKVDNIFCSKTMRL